MGQARNTLIEGSDLSPYLNVKEMDPKWLEAVGGDPEAPKKAAIEELSK